VSITEPSNHRNPDQAGSIRSQFYICFTDFTPRQLVADVLAIEGHLVDVRRQPNRADAVADLNRTLTEIRAAMLAGEHQIGGAE
jgi:hypothetical protein